MDRVTRLDGLLWALLLLAWSTSPAWAWKQLKADKTNQPLSWHSMPIKWGVDAAGLGDHFSKNPAWGAVGSEFDAVLLAFQSWEKIFCPSGGPVGIKFENLGRLTSQKVGADPNCDSCNVNLVVFVRNKDLWTRPSTELAVALPTYRDFSGKIFDADILINAAHFNLSTVDSDPAAVQWDIQNAVTHEIGHLLGLAHSDDAKATMVAKSVQGDLELRSIAEDDVAGICTLYPPQNVNGKVPKYIEKEKNRGFSGCSSLQGPIPMWALLLPLLLLWMRRP